MNIFTWIAGVFQSLRHVFAKKSREPIVAEKDFRGVGVDTFLGKRASWVRAMFHHPSAQKRSGLRHRPYTKAPYNFKKAKRLRKIATRSQHINWRQL